MDLQLKDKVAVVTGASKGIGLAIATALARDGARVVAGSRTTTAELEALRARHAVTVVPVDLGRADGPALLIQAAKDACGRVDILINNLGATKPRAGFLDVDDAEWLRVFDLTFFSAVRASRAALPHLLASGRGAIVNISSINARLPFPSVVDYSAAKAALSNLTKALSEEFAPRGVRVNAIAPGPIDTDLTATMTPEDRQAFINALPAGRFGRPEEIAATALLLAGPQGGFYVGACLSPNGGDVMH
jgi:NAD(P)-dependent dehydrogenase (short-subunit alcohol dehydrogenase family)